MADNPQMKPQPKAEALEGVTAKTTPPPIRSRLTDTERARLGRLADSYRARAVAEMKDVLEVILQLAGERSESLVPDLGLTGAQGGELPGDKSDGFEMPHPELLGDLPGNTDAAPYDNASPSERGAARDDAASLRPSGDPRSWVTGAASQDEGPIYDKSTTTDNGDGTTTTRTESYNSETGTVTNTQETRDRNGNLVYRLQVVDYADGSSEGSTMVAHAGGSEAHQWARDANGAATMDYFQSLDRRGRVTDDWDRLRNPERRIDRLPTDDEGSELGRRLGRRFGRRPTSKRPEPNRVNPGDPDDSGPKGEKIDPGDSIVVNPASVRAQQGRSVSSARAEHWKNSILEKVGGRVNPEGGGIGLG